MPDAISAASSALDAMSVTMAVTANNVANLDTDNFQSQRVNLSTAEDAQGVQVASISQDTTPGSPIPGSASGDTVSISDAGKAMAETSNVDLTRESVTMIEASRGFEANIAVIRTQDALTGTLLDMRA